ncbi:dnaJ homolog subfamily C member 17 [Stomoxys calcitrans]|uniref:dnaJ homolog subfamily C member 17 n=1 Tax=Stomoxys calcitrans TaxID=35570 RepID=UPI0027E307F3|nr:dnaJ homolog subfamily C member 17 [Stomoxys calcitrans]
MTKKYEDVNLYELLGIEPEAQEHDIRKAYRKKALACHPDKNPDNPKAAELFHELSNALQVLTDTAARLAYDKVLKSKKAAEIRHKQLDSKRQKLKEDLLLREQEALHAQYSRRSSSYTVVQKTDEEILQEQIERLRREGSRLLEEEQRLLREQLQTSFADQAQKNRQSEEAQCYRLKIKWNSNGGYTEDKLMTYMKKYGDVVALVMSKKCGSALIEFKTLEAAELALAYEKGALENPLRIEWVDAFRKEANSRKTQTPNSTIDYEDLVMRKLRQAEERKRLIEQMQKEDELE